MITLFCLFLLLCLSLCLLYTGIFIGLWILGIVLFVIGLCNLWKAKWLEPNDFKDKEHLERTKKRTRQKGMIQAIIGFILFIIFLV